MAKALFGDAIWSLDKIELTGVFVVERTGKFGVYFNNNFP
ncbi:MAG: hypothetical protein ACI9C4_003025 [Paraglaciecola sp.]|jgi:hypothetical protein